MNLDFYDHFKYCLLEDKLPHAFLIESNNVDSASDSIVELLYKENLIKNIDPSKNLNLILIEPDGKDIQTHQIIYLHERFSTIPVNDKYNIYLIKNAEKLNMSAANKLLKFLEEPSSSILGLLIIDFNYNVIETIKSRCQTFFINEEVVLDKIKGDAENLYNFITESQDYKKEIEIKNNLSKLERKELIILFEELLKRNDTSLNKLIQSFEIKNITKNICLIDKILQLLKSNVNIDLVLDNFFIELRKK